MEPVYNGGTAARKPEQWGKISVMAGKVNDHTKPRGNEAIEQKLAQAGIEIRLQYSPQDVRKNQDGSISISPLVSKSGKVVQLCMYIKDENEKEHAIVIAECPSEDYGKALSSVRNTMKVAIGEEWIEEQKKQDIYYTNEGKRIVMSKKECDITKTAFTELEKDEINKVDISNVYNGNTLDICNEASIISELEQYMIDSYEEIKGKFNIKSIKTDGIKLDFSNEEQRKNYMRLEGRLKGYLSEIKYATAVREELGETLQEKGILFSSKGLKLNDDGIPEISHELEPNDKKMYQFIVQALNQDGSYTKLVIGSCPLMKVRMCKEIIKLSYQEENENSIKEAKSELESLGFILTPEGNDILTKQKGEINIVRTQPTQEDKWNEQDMENITKYRTMQQELQEKLPIVMQIKKEKEIMDQNKANIKAVFEKIEQYIEDKNKNQGRVNTDTLLGLAFANLMPLDGTQNKEFKGEEHQYLVDMLEGIKEARRVASKLEKGRYLMHSHEYKKDADAIKFDTYMGLRQRYMTGEITMEDYHEQIARINDPKIVYQMREDKRTEDMQSLKKNRNMDR